MCDQMVDGHIADNRLRYFWDKHSHTGKFYRYLKGSTATT